jgi:hypothetical protein
VIIYFNGRLFVFILWTFSIPPGCSFFSFFLGQSLGYQFFSTAAQLARQQQWRKKALTGPGLADTLIDFI